MNIIRHKNLESFRAYDSSVVGEQHTITVSKYAGEHKLFVSAASRSHSSSMQLEPAEAQALIQMLTEALAAQKVAA